ncbi:MAG: D-alanyl-D-alanine carboxypeptidase family protein [Pyrinomonadaceae bacterium]
MLSLFALLCAVAATLVTTNRFAPLLRVGDFGAVHAAMPAQELAQFQGDQIEVALPNEAAAAGADFAQAARQNAELQNSLSWTFGAKQQRGWHLYVPLIGRLIETEAGADAAEFAAAVARWQRARGLGQTGVIDANTLHRMIQTWQGQRLKDRTPASAGQLVTVPAAEFYDSSRPAELRQVERETYAAYQRMVAAANAAGVAEGKYLKIISAHRSREYQDALRRKDPKAGSAGLAVNNSPHFTGRALDLYVGGDPVETKDSNRAIQVRTPAYRWLVRHAERFGFRPYHYEPWHWERVQ